MFGQEECLSQENKRRRIDGETEENVGENNAESDTVTTESRTTESRTDSEPITDTIAESPTAENRIDSEPIAVESPTISRSQEDVMIVGDVQVTRPEVIDLERLPTIRQGTVYASYLITMWVEASYEVTFPQTGSSIKVFFGRFFLLFYFDNER